MSGTTPVEARGPASPFLSVQHTDPDRSPKRERGRRLRPAPWPSDRRVSLWPWPVLFFGVAVLGLTLQGTRGLWEPDEGFYANPAIEMLRSGDWWTPRLNGEPFLDKPPLVYWTIATGMSLFGVNEWGARAGHALWYAATSLLVGLLGATWWGRRAGVMASLVYATSLLPFLASNALTPDTPLAFCSTLAYYVYWRLEQESHRRPRLLWGMTLGVALGLGGLAKGPVILLMAAPLVVFTVVRRRSARWILDPAFLTAWLVFLALALPWYALMAWRWPGGAEYLLDNQVLGRLFTAKYGRNAPWYGSLAVYVPALALGSLPWTPLLLRKLWTLRRTTRKALVTQLLARPEVLYLLSWFVLPLCVFAVARSRLPLYVLPLFAPMSLAVGRFLSERRPRLSLVAAAPASWLLTLCFIKLLAAHYPSDSDSRRMARELAAIGIAPSQLIVSVDTKQNALAMYGFRKIKQVTLSNKPYPFYSPPKPLSEELEAMDWDGAARAFVVPYSEVTRLTRFLAHAGVPFTEKRLHLPYGVVEVPRAELAGLTSADIGSAPRRSRDEPWRPKAREDDSKR